MRVAFLLALCGCGRLGFAGAEEREIPHATGYERAGDRRLVVRDDIDTDAGGIGGLAFIEIAQDGGPALALVDVDTFVVEPGIHVRVTGSRGLIIAARTIQIDGDLDAGGRGATAGAGASTTSGARGKHVGTDVCDHGGSGGGYATAGGDGGRGTGCDDSPRSPGGIAFGDASVAILVGGARGGNGVSLECGDAAGGGGGGALELSAQETLTITGAVRASGGGGAGGLECNMNGDAGSGGGGGAGGAIYLDARHLVITGTVAAFGGGGGGGGNGNTDNGPVGAGATGTDGGTTFGTGGAGIAPNAGIGGQGGGDAPPSSGGDVIHNGGGGGGAAGRIVIVGQ
jgi:hypothetical protein